MTSTSTFPSLSAPAPEDSMEVSSPTNRHMDGDIDIDFDYNYDGIHLTDDERMLEDHEHPRPGTATDDLMQDDEQTVTAPLMTEEVMYDDTITDVQPQRDEDDELIDYEDEEYMENPVETIDGAIQNVNHAQDPVVHHVQDTLHVNGDPVPSSEVGVVEKSTIDVTSSGDAEIIGHTIEPQTSDSAIGRDVHSVIEAAHPVEDNLQSIAADQNSSENAKGEAETTVGESIPGTQVSDREAQPVEKSTDYHADDTNVTELTGISHADEPRTPSDTGLHPMIVHWRGHSLPLFKSRVQLEGLLKDDNLVNISLADFMSSLKEQLALRLGETVPHDEELVLKFECLALTVVEDSPACFEASLNDILEVYLLLHQNDGTQEIPFFELTLTQQPKFKSVLDFLKESAAQGQGISIAEALCHQVDEGEFYDEDNEYAGQEEAAADTDGNEYEHGDGENTYDDAAPDQTGEEEFPLGLDQDEHAYDQEGYYEDPDTGNHDEPRDRPTTAGDDNNQNAELEEIDYLQEFVDQEDPVSERKETNQASGSEKQQPTTDTGNDNVEVQAGEKADAVAAASSSQAAAKPQPRIVSADSVGGPTKVRVDAANYISGEYLDDDLISFDDDDLIVYGSEHRTESQQGNPSTVVTNAGHPNGQDLDSSKVTGTLKMENGNSLDSVDPDNKDQNAFPLESDDLFNVDVAENVEHGIDNPKAGDTKPSYEGVGEDTEEFDIAYHPDDVDDGDQVAKLPPDQNEDDDEQFHTAYDLLEGVDTVGKSGDDHGSHDDKSGYTEAFDDEINFDDDDDDLLPATNTSAHDSVISHSTAHKTSLAPKRSFNELNEPDDLLNDEHEAKKARAG